MEQKPSMMESKFKNKLSFYKPNKTGSGSAVQFDLNASKQSVFVEISHQNGERSFDWANKITFKLSLMELGKLLSVLKGRAPQVQLYHDPSKGDYALAKEMKNATLALSRSDYGYFLKITQQGQDGKLNTIQTNFTEDEGIILEVVFAKAVTEIAGW